MASQDYLWECEAILLWAHVLGVVLTSDGGDEFPFVRRYSKLA